MSIPPKKRPRDPNQLAKMIADIAAGNVQDEAPQDERNPAAVALGSRGGKRSAATRKLTREQLSQMGKKGAKARWGK